MAMLNKVKLQICGTEYSVSSEEPEEYMRELGVQLDRDMRTLMNNDERVSTQTADNLRAQMRDYLDDNARARQEADNARREADRLRRELDDLRRGR